MIDRAALVAQALRESKSLAEARETVETLLRLAGEVPETRPLDGLDKREVLQSPAATPPQHPATPAKARKATRRTFQWHRMPELCARATRLLDDAGLQNAARVLGCSTHSLRKAVRHGHVKPQVWKPDPLLSARCYKAAITRGQNLQDYAKAQEVLDRADEMRRVRVVNGVGRE